jgi:hypothetical protein
MTSDFLKNLRSGTEKKSSNRRHYDQHNYHHESQKQYFGNEKRAGADRRKGKPTRLEDAVLDAIKELVPVIVNLAGKTSKYQERLLELEAEKARAESAKVEAINTLVELLKSGDGILAHGGMKRKQRARKPLDQNRKKILQVIASMRDKGETFDNIALQLEKENLRTFSGRGQWHAQTVHRLFQDHLADQ